MCNSKFSSVFILGMLLTLALYCLLFAGCGRSALVFSPDPLPQAAIGQAYQATIKISENSTPVGSMTIDSGSLPSGLAFQFNKGTDSAVITGTPSQSGSFKFTLGAWCMGTNSQGQSGTHNYLLLVK